MISRRPFRFAPVAILGALFLMLVGAGYASAEYVENVDCNSDQDVVDATAKCFKEKLPNCPEKNKVAAGCRNNKQYCACTKKKDGEKDKAEEKAEQQKEKAYDKAKKEKMKAIKKAVKQMGKKDGDKNYDEELMRERLIEREPELLVD